MARNLSLVGVSTAQFTVGAAGEVDDRTLDELQSLEDVAMLQAADPQREDGTAALDAAGQRRRDEAIVAKLLECSEPIAVVILGGSHDVTGGFQASDRCVRYVKVETRSFRRAGTD